MPTKAKQRVSSSGTSRPPLIEDIEPQLATLVDRPPAVGQWVYEVAAGLPVVRKPYQFAELEAVLAGLCEKAVQA